MPACWRQIVEFKPRLAVVATDSVRESLIGRLGETGMPVSAWPELRCDARARIEAASAPEVDFVMSAIVGVAGLEATYAAAKLGKRIGLANKEVLVASGKLVTEAAREAGAELIPVDSEHNGVHHACGPASGAT